VREGSGREHDVLPVTASIGFAEAAGRHSSIGLVTKAAYRALYEAKGEGGNLIKRGTLSADVPKALPAEGGRIVAYSEFES
jgi:hypothetical protein